MPADRPMPPASRGLDDLYDIGRLAARLGVEHSTIRVWLSRKVPWLPQPDGRLNGGAVWRASTLEGIEERRTPGRPGRKRAFAPATASADIARTGPLPVVDVATGSIPVVATVTGAIPAVAAVTGAIPAVATVTGSVPAVATLASGYPTV